MKDYVTDSSLVFIVVFCVCQTSGYLNLLANCIDNFTHGLAVAGSFLVSKKVRSCDDLNTRNPLSAHKVHIFYLNCCCVCFHRHFTRPVAAAGALRMCYVGQEQQL